MRFSMRTAVELQLDSVTEEEANQNFEFSCKLCCKCGFNVDCDHCPVASANKQKLAAILDLRIAEKQRELAKAKELEQLRKFIDSIVG